MVVVEGARHGREAPEGAGGTERVSEYPGQEGHLLGFKDLSTRQIKNPRRMASILEGHLRL